MNEYEQVTAKAYEQMIQISLLDREAYNLQNRFTSLNARLDALDDIARNL